MKHVKGAFVGLVSLCLLVACDSDEPGVNDGGVVILQNQKPLQDTLSIVEKQQDSLFYWDPGSIEIPIQKGEDIVITQTNIELTKAENRAKITFNDNWERTQRDSLSKVSFTLVSTKGDSSVRDLVIRWKGIYIPDSLWQKITLEPARIGKIAMYPGEKCSIEFTWKYPWLLHGLLKAEVANQTANEVTPNWQKIALGKKKFTSAFSYGQNLTARFRVTGRKGGKEVSFAVISK